MKDYKKALLININDNIATVLDNVYMNDMINIIYNNQIYETIIAIEDIELFHKVAIRNIIKGSELIKYGEVIGRASSNILKGQHAHINNIESVKIKNENKCL